WSSIPQCPDPADPSEKNATAGDCATLRLSRACDTRDIRDNGFASKIPALRGFPPCGLVLHRPVSRAMTVRILSVSVLCALVGCKASPAAEPPPRGPGEVGIVTLKTESVTLQTEL